MRAVIRWAGVLAVRAMALGLARDSPRSAGEEDPYLGQELVLGPYVIRMEWPRDASDIRHVPIYGKIVTTWKGSQRVVETEWVYELGPLTGTDITGDGYPDVAVEHYSGGAHCCSFTAVYSLGPTVERFPAGRDSNCSGEFRDLDGDGAYEFLTCDDIFAYSYCSFADSPLVRVVLRFEPGVGYVPAEAEFPEAYAEDIAVNTTLAEAARGGEGRFPGWDGTPKCEVLPLVLDYLYSGQIERGWEDLDRCYRYPDAGEFRAEVEAQLRQSPYCPLPQP